jgi:hypothetical protein
MKADAYSFARQVDQKIEALPDDVYHRRLGRAKRLREELLPLSRLGLRMKQPGLAVEVEGFEDNRPADGAIRISGFRPREFEVQLTFAGYGYEEALRSEHLVKKGFVPGAGFIARDTKTRAIDAKTAAIDDDEHFCRIAGAIIDQFGEKSRNAYGAGAVLVIALEEIKLSGFQSWSRLLSIIGAAGGIGGSRFSQVFLFNEATNELYEAA